MYITVSLCDELRLQDFSFVSSKIVCGKDPVVARQVVITFPEV